MLLNQKQVKEIKKKYEVGTKMILVEMEDDYAVPAGTKGTITAIDDQEQLTMKWEKGLLLFQALTCLKLSEIKK